MSIALNDLEKAINSGLSTAVKKSEINFDQLFIEVDLLRHVQQSPCLSFEDSLGRATCL